MIDLAITYAGLLGEAVVRTIAIAVLSFGLGFAISSLLTLARFFAPAPLRLLVQAYVDFFRGTPLLVQILLLYFGLPSIGVKLDAFTAAVVAIGLNSGAYQAEILRTAIKGIPEEQVLVARSLGFSEAQVFRYIVFPQAVRNALPGLSNEVVTLLKESALASVIGVMELTRVGEYMTAATFRALEAYTLVALIYLAISYAFFRTLRASERRLAIPGFERWV
jgi:polar amino acid transport system permease protein